MTAKASVELNNLLASNNIVKEVGLTIAKQHSAGTSSMLCWELLGQDPIFDWKGATLPREVAAWLHYGVISCTFTSPQVSRHKSAGRYPVTSLVCGRRGAAKDGLGERHQKNGKLSGSWTPLPPLRDFQCEAGRLSDMEYRIVVVCGFEICIQTFWNWERRTVTQG